MPKRSHCQSALFIGTGDDDEVGATVLVVGGQCGNEDEAALLTNRPHQTRGEQGNRGSQWRWRQLSPMRKARPFGPGLLLLGGERVLVCGGGWDTTVEILQLPVDDNEKGVWTLLTQEMTQSFWSIYLVNFNNRIFAVGESLITLVTTRPKPHLTYINCLHLRLERAAGRVDINVHFHAPSKNSSTGRSLCALFSTASLFLTFRMHHWRPSCGKHSRICSQMAIFMHVSVPKGDIHFAFMRLF